MCLKKTFFFLIPPVFLPRIGFPGGMVRGFAPGTCKSPGTQVQIPGGQNTSAVPVDWI